MSTEPRSLRARKRSPGKGSVSAVFEIDTLHSAASDATQERPLWSTTREISLTWTDSMGRRMHTRCLALLAKSLTSQL